MDHQHRKPLRVGMVGGGPGGFIGQVHRHAMCLDGNYTLVAGMFSRDATTSAALGASLGISSSRLYTSFEQMAESEAALPVEERIQLCVVVTPTPTHAEAALAFISRGFPVVCDKPLCSTIAEADRVINAIEENQTEFMLIHNYSGYPMVKQARSMVLSPCSSLPAALSLQSPCSSPCTSPCTSLPALSLHSHCSSLVVYTSLKLNLHLSLALILAALSALPLLDYLRFLKLFYNCLFEFLDDS